MAFSYEAGQHMDWISSRIHHDNYVADRGFQAGRNRYILPIHSVQPNRSQVVRLLQQLADLAAGIIVRVVIHHDDFQK